MAPPSRTTPRSSSAGSKPATPKAIPAPPDKVTRKYREEFVALVGKLPECDLDAATAEITVHHTLQRQGVDRKKERLRLLSAHDADGRSITWIEHVRGERSLQSSLSSTFSTPASSTKTKAKGKQRVLELSSDEGDVFDNLPASEDEGNVDLTPTPTPLKSALKLKKSTTPREPITPSKAQLRPLPLPIDSSSDSEIEPRMVDESLTGLEDVELAKATVNLRLESDAEAAQRDSPVGPRRSTPRLDRLRRHSP
ncbi:hypothetical protein JCM8208_006212 [Rhodotorula glutinis]